MRRREFRYIYKPGNPSRTRGRAYLFHVCLTTTRNINEIQISILLIMILCEILLFIYFFVLILEIKINQDWNRSFKTVIVLVHTPIISLLKRGATDEPCRLSIDFWLAVHGKPVLFWKGTSGLKFPCFLFMHANGTGPFEFRAVPIL